MALEKETDMAFLKEADRMLDTELASFGIFATVTLFRLPLADRPP